MKRNTLKLFAGMLGMTVLLSITACGSSDETEKAPVTTITADTETKSKENEAQTKTKSQDKAEKQAESEAQDKTETPAETKTQDKAETPAETMPQDKAETPTETVPQDKAETQAKKATKTETDKEETADDSKQYETLEDYFNEPETRNTFDKQIASSSTDDITILYDVKGNEFTCTIKFTNNSVISANVDDMKAALDAGLEAQADTFKTLAKELDGVIRKEGACTIIVRYTDLDGNMFAEKAFKAD